MAEAVTPAPRAPVRVGLFVTCLVDLMRPSVGFAAVKLLEDAGCQVIVPGQTCCGQPAYNSGDRATTRDIARQVIAAFEGCDYVVAPSGSCAGMLSRHYPELFAGEPELARKAQAFAARTFELVSFLVDVMNVSAVAARYDGEVAYHDSCSGLRELGIAAQPRKLLGGVAGLRLVEFAGRRRLLRLRRHFRGQIRRNLRRHRRAEDRQRHGERRADPARRRSRLPDEHGRQAAAPGQRGEGAPCRRSARRHDRGAADRRHGASARAAAGAVR